jgi:hypothetical protein
MPLNDPGLMVLPTVWVPRPIGTCKSPTAEPLPDEEPPGVRSGSWAFVVLGPLCEGPTTVAANSVVVVFPIYQVTIELP